MGNRVLGSRLFRYVMVLVLPVSLLLTRHADAQECDKLLTPDTTTDISRNDVRLAYLHTLDRTKYDQVSHSAGFEATIPVDGVPLKEAGNYGDFQKHLARESERLQYQFNQSQAKWYFETRIPVERTNAYLDCMNGMHKNLVLHVRERTNDNRVVFELKWVAPASVTSAVTVDFSESVNATSATHLQRVTLNDKQEKTFVFQRTDPKGDMVIVANSDYDTVSYKDPAPNELKPEPPPTPLSAITVLLSRSWKIQITYGQDLDHSLRSATNPSDAELRFTQSNHGYVVWKIVNGQRVSSADADVTQGAQDTSLHIQFRFDDLIPSGTSPFCRYALSSSHGALFEVDFNPKSLTLSGVVKVAHPDQVPPYVCAFVDPVPG